MWFKNLQIYRMKGWNITTEALNEQLSIHPLQPCLSMAMQSIGWVSPKEENESFVAALGQHSLIALGTEKKLLPASVINQLAKERALEIEQQQGYKPGRKQLKEIKEDVTVELLPRAFTVRHKTYAWIDTVGGWFVIDTSNINKADEFVETLFKSIDDVTLKPLSTNISPTVAMTGWLSGSDIPAVFTVDRHCELRAMDDEQSTVSYTRHALDSEEIAQHVKVGKEATKLAITWRDKISFVLHENMQLRRVAPLDVLKEPAETADELFDNDLTMMTGELAQLLPDLIDALGGEENA